MKQLARAMLVFMMTVLASPVFAVKNAEVQTKAISIEQQTQGKTRLSPLPTGNQLQNQEQGEVNNEGEDLLQNREREAGGESFGTRSQNRNQNAIQQMSEVATQVQQLLQIRTTGGIGEQVRAIAQAQNQAQAQIQEQLNKLESKGKLARLLTGTDFGAVKNLKQQLEQNRLRVQQLEQLQNQLSNREDIALVHETIQALIQENTFLQERVVAEEQTRSLFGWLLKLASREKST